MVIHMSVQLQVPLHVLKLLMNQYPPEFDEMVVLNFTLKKYSGRFTFLEEKLVHSTKSDHRGCTQYSLNEKGKNLLICCTMPN